MGSAVACACAWARAQELAPPSAGANTEAEAELASERKHVEELGEKAGLRPFRMSQSANYLGIGDAVDGFRSLTLRDCEAVRSDFLDHYRAKGFKVAGPERPMTVVTLADDRSFAAFLGKRDYTLTLGNLLQPHVHGVFQMSKNRLIVFDHRSLGPQLAPRAGLENLRALAHEATHQLTFNTGMLELRGDVPACISEGLAMYGEVRKSSGRTAPGEINLMRLRDLARMQRQGTPWIAVATLLANDRLFRGSRPGFESVLAYAESWLLIYYIMNEPSYLFGFRRYLAAIHARTAPDGRLDDARAHLGDLDRLNQELREYAVKLQKSL